MDKEMSRENRWESLILCHFKSDEPELLNKMSVPVRFHNYSSDGRWLAGTPAPMVQDCGV